MKNNGYLNQDSQPLVSVIIPVYNVEPYLRICVDSILKQTYSNIEIILVDDGSPDNCPKICDEYSIKDSRVRVIHKTNGGLYAARQTGIEQIRGEYFSFVDSDDYISPDYIEKLLNCAIENNADIVSCNFFMVNGKLQTEIYENPGLNGKESILKLLQGNLDGYTWLKLIRTEIIKNNIYFKVDKLSMWEDVLFSVELYYYSKKISYISHPLYYYRYNPNSLCNTFSEQKITDFITAITLIENFLKSKEIISDYEKALNSLKARAKVLIIVQSPYKLRKQYLRIFSEADSFIFKTQSIPIYNKLEALCFINHLNAVGYLIKLILFIARKIRNQIRSF